MRVPPLYNPAVKILVWGLAALLGAGVALGQAPFGLWGVALVALSLLIAMGQATSPFRVGLAAGSGYVATAIANAGKARALVAALPALLKGPAVPCEKGCTHVLDGAIMTAPAKRDPEVIARLMPVMGRVLKG